MPNRSTVIHPRFQEAIEPLGYPTVIAIDVRTVAQDPETGEETYTWAPRPGHDAVPATMAPLTLQSVSNREIVGDKAIWIESAWHISMSGYYPAIEPTDRVRLDDGRTFNIIGVEHDSHRQFTRLKAEEVR